MKKIVVYLATRNYYDKVLPSMKSLLYHTDVDHIYLLIENNEFPYKLPDNVTCINVKDQKFYREDGPNIGKRWTYVALMKPILCKILPEDVDYALCLDADTIILDDISSIFDLPIEEYYFAAAAEPSRCQKNYLYVNIGVALFNLKKLRDGKAEEIQKALDTKDYAVVDQDALIEHCQGAILEMPGCYNACRYTTANTPPVIRHFAAENGWYDDPLVKPYKSLFFEEIQALKKK